MINKIILASASPRRKEILENVGITPEIIVSDAEETGVLWDCPQEAVQQLALQKGKAVLKKIENSQEEKLIVSADTVVVMGKTVLGKPKNREDAFDMIKNLSGKSHKVITGICVINTLSKKTCTDYEETEVYFKNLSDEDIINYLDTNEYCDKAGGYGIQGKGAFLVKKICGDYFNVVGLPIGLLYDLIKNEFISDVKKSGGLVC